MLSLQLQHSASQKDSIVPLLPLPVVGGLKKKKTEKKQNRERETKGY